MNRVRYHNQKVAVIVAIAACALLGACASGIPDPAAARQSDGDRSSSANGESLPKIVGGEPFEGLPAVGALTEDGAPFCTGTLVAEQLVLTAAHCVAGVDPDDLRFAIGASAWEPDVEIAVSSTFVHPVYNARTLINDLGLVVLAEPVPAEPIALLDEMDGSWVGEELLFVGYGFDNGYDETGEGIKRAVTMPIDEVYETQFEFGGPERNICGGDSGSPVLYVQPDGSQLIVGVTSSGDDYCVEFGYAMRVDRYYDFISGERYDPCNGETFFGRCDGDTLVWCEGGEVLAQECAEFGASCELDGDDGFYCL